MTHFAGKAAKVLFLSVVTTLLLAATALAADQAVAGGATTGSSLRMRADASTSASIVATLDKGVAVAILDDDASSGWYRVSYDGKTGFISADYLAVDQDNVFTSYGKVNSDGVNVRSGASTDASVLASVDADTIVTVNGFENGWYDVTCEYGTTLQIADGVKVRFVDAGHLLGSASVEMWLTEGDDTRKVVFSGDIGNRDQRF